MVASLVVSSVLVVSLAGSTLSQAVSQATRAPVPSQWPMAGVAPGFPGVGTGQGFRQGFRGQGYRGDGRYGFEIIDAPDRYGYVSTYPGGRTSFFLLGPNRGPGQEGWRGSTGGSQLGSYRPGPAYMSGTNPNSLGSGGWRQPGASYRDNKLSVPF